MTYAELKIQFDLNPDSRVNVLKNASIKRINVGYLFIDSDDGNCYLFSKDGNQIGISNLEQIEDDAFNGCMSLTNITIPDSVKSIGNAAFASCTSLTSIRIPDSVKSIGYEAFWNCTSLKSIQIPDSVKIIGYEAFTGCNSLKEVLFKGKTIEEVKKMDCYPWRIKDKSIIKAEMPLQESLRESKHDLQIHFWAHMLDRAFEK